MESSAKSAMNVNDIFLAIGKCFVKMSTEHSYCSHWCIGFSVRNDEFAMLCLLHLIGGLFCKEHYDCIILF